MRPTPTNQAIQLFNQGRRTVTVSFTHQVFTNSSWFPAPEELFRHPSHDLPAGATVGYLVPDPPTNAPWRFAVLVQRHYGNGVLGELRESLDRWLHPRDFRPDDHRRRGDAFLFSKALGESPASMGESTQRQQSATDH